MTPSKLTEIKNAAAKKIGYSYYTDFSMRLTAGDPTALELEEKFHDTCIELSYAEAMREVRDKLPTDDEIDMHSWQTCNTEKQRNVYFYGAKWAIEQIKKLLIP